MTYRSAPPAPAGKPAPAGTAGLSAEAAALILCRNVDEPWRRAPVFRAGRRKRPRGWIFFVILLTLAYLLGAVLTRLGL